MCVHCCAWLSYTTQHWTVLILFPFILQTIIIAQMLSIGEGNAKTALKQCGMRVAIGSLMVNGRISNNDSQQRVTWAVSATTSSQVSATSFHAGNVIAFFTFSRDRTGLSATHCLSITTMKPIRSSLSILLVHLMSICLFMVTLYM